jgi:hypothetical protein
MCDKKCKCQKKEKIECRKEKRCRKRRCEDDIIIIINAPVTTPFIPLIA